MLEPLGVALLAAALVAAATLAARRWGHAVGGVVSAFPLIIGPVLVLATLRHGEAFAGRAAAATLLGLVSLAGFAVAYAATAAHAGWRASLSAAWVVAGTLGAAATGIEAGLAASAAVAALALGAAWAVLPRPGVPVPAPAAPRWDLPLRVALTAALILLLTAAADRFGAVAAGALSALPTLASVLAVATHRRDGHDALLALLRGTLEGMAGFAVFCAVAGAALERTGIVAAFALATAAAVLVQAAAGLRPRAPLPVEAAR